jgi:hypothetical protein
MSVGGSLKSKEITATLLATEAVVASFLERIYHGHKFNWNYHFIEIFNNIFRWNSFHLKTKHFHRRKKRIDLNHENNGKCIFLFSRCNIM